MYSKSLKPLLLSLLLLGFISHHPLMGQVYLQGYIETGLQGNLVMKQKNISLQQSLLALKEARSWFYPSADFTGDYNWAEGGRTIDLPIGDLLNPVYSTLNQLTEGAKCPVTGTTNG